MTNTVEDALAVLWAPPAPCGTRPTASLWARRGRGAVPGRRPRVHGGVASAVRRAAMSTGAYHAAAAAAKIQQLEPMTAVPDMPSANLLLVPSRHLSGSTRRARPATAGRRGRSGHDGRRLFLPADAGLAEFTKTDPSDADNTPSERPKIPPTTTTVGRTVVAGLARRAHPAARPSRTTHSPSGCGTALARPPRRPRLVPARRHWMRWRRRLPRGTATERIRLPHAQRRGVHTAPDRSHQSGTGAAARVNSGAVVPMPTDDDLRAGC